MKLILRLFFMITGGRPMRYVAWGFTDKVSGRPVLYYRDRRDGALWLAEGAWARFRVRSASTEEDIKWP